MKLFMKQNGSFKLQLAELEVSDFIWLKGFIVLSLVLSYTKDSKIQCILQILFIFSVSEMSSTLDGDT